MAGIRFRKLHSQLNLIPLFPLLLVLPIPTGTSMPLQRRPWVTIILVWLNFLIFLVTRLSGSFEDILWQFGYTPVEDRFVTLFTSMFLHGGVMHVFFNMLFLWMYGANVEDKMGRVGFLFFYLASGIAAAYTFAWTAGPVLSGMPCIGASGAVFGVMGAFLVLMPLVEIRFTIIVEAMLFFWRIYTIPIAALFIAPLYLLINLMFGSVQAELGVGAMAHVGGFLFAMPCGLLYRWLHAKPKTAPQQEIKLEDNKIPDPSDEQEQLLLELRQALMDRERKETIQLYRQGQTLYGSLPLPAVDLLLLAEGMVIEEEFLSAAEVYRRIGKDVSVEESLRVKAGIELGRLYLENFGEAPRAIRLYRRLLEKFPLAPQAKEVRRLLNEVIQIGYPPEGVG